MNVDDDEMCGDDDDGKPGPEDARLLDNSGWSSRTRCVFITCICLLVYIHIGSRTRISIGMLGVHTFLLRMVIITDKLWILFCRAVAKYLQTIFDNEGGNERKVISVDSLLAGKTRKEASRMFFETLVCVAHLGCSENHIVF